MTDRVALLAALFAAAAAPAAAEASTAKPVAVLLCAAPQDAMCRALVGALDRIGRTVEVVPPGGERRVAPAATTLSFVEEDRSAHHIAGRLVWTGADGTAGRGETLHFEVSDAAMTDAMLGNFADALVHQTAFPA